MLGGVATIHPGNPRREGRRLQVESRLKEEIMEDPGRWALYHPPAVLGVTVALTVSDSWLVCRYIKLDPELPNVLLDMKESGKTLLLITNSDWPYTSTMMEFAYNRCPLLPVLYTAVFSCLRLPSSPLLSSSSSGFDYCIVAALTFVSFTFVDASTPGADCPLSPYLLLSAVRRMDL